MFGSIDEPDFVVVEILAFGPRYDTSATRTQLKLFVSLEVGDSR